MSYPCIPSNNQSSRRSTESGMPRRDSPSAHPTAHGVFLLPTARIIVLLARTQLAFCLLGNYPNCLVLGEGRAA